MIEAMQQTEHYKLNLIEMDDPISPLPLNENTQVLDQLVAGIAGEQRLFKLRETAVTADTGPLVLDLSGVDVTQYNALLLVYHLNRYGGSRYIRINNSNTLCVLEGSTTQNTPNNLDGVGLLLLFSFGDSVVGMSQAYGAFIGMDSGKNATRGRRFEVPWAEIQTVGFSTDVPIGSGAVLYGIRF